jgi:hypothetical protein
MVERCLFKAHAAQHFAPGTANVDILATIAEFGCPLDHGHLEIIVLSKPPGRCTSSNAGAGNQHASRHGSPL